MKRLLMILALATSGGTHAVPVVFSSMQYDVLAFAEAGPVFDGPNDLAGDAAAGLIASADVDTGDDLASASGVADTFFLATSVEAFSTREFAGGVGVASFLGEFNGAGRYRLTVDFDRFDDVTDGSSDAVLAIGLNAGDSDLIDTVLFGATSFIQDFSLASGLGGLLELSLVSTAEAFEGSAFNLSSAEFQLQRVPEPGSLALVALSLGLLGARRIIPNNSVDATRVVQNARSPRLCGRRRCTHANSIRCDGVNRGLLGMNTVAGEDLVRQSAALLRDAPWTMGIDTMIMPPYGKQHGAVVSYHPHPPANCAIVSGYAYARGSS